MNTVKAFFDSIQAKNAIKVAKLIESDPSLKTSRSERRNTPLYGAVAVRSIEIVRLLIEKGCDVNEPSGTTISYPLQLACYRGDIEMVKLLLDHGANPNVVSDTSSPIQEAISGESKEHLAILNLLFKHGVKLNMKNPSGANTLEYACSFSYLPTVERILKEVKNINERSSAGTALHKAVYNGEIHVVELLLSKGADPTIRAPATSQGYPGKTAIQVAEEILGSNPFAKNKNKNKILALLKGGGEKPSSQSKKRSAWTWTELLFGLKEHYPDVWKSFSKPAKPELLQKLQTKIPHELPTPFLDYLTAVNGQKHGRDPFAPGADKYDAGYQLMPIQEIVSDWTMMNKLNREGNFDGLPTGADKGIQEVIWQDAWVPFATNGGGDYLCLDFRPAKGGTKGQIITYDHESGRRELVAKSFEHWLKDVVEEQYSLLK